MMTQEEFMNVQTLHAAGWTIRQIAEHVGYHPATVSGWLKQRWPAADAASAGRRCGDRRTVADRGSRGCWRRTRSCRRRSIMRVIGAEGFDGSYPTLTRHLRSVRGPTRGRAGLGVGDGADRDGPGRGVPVRLVRLQPVGPPVGLGP